MNNKLPRLSISAINVNSMNVSTLGMSQSKTLLKVEGVTMKKTDIILLSDVRAKDKGDCFASSPWRPHTEDKRMVLEHTHGLFIT
jgi:hypothetical protein